MTQFPLRKVGSILWMIFIIASTLFILSLVLSLRAEMKANALSLSVVAAGNLMLSIAAYMALSRLKQGIIEIFKQVMQKLDRREENLHVTEKMATLGRLAAGVAHEIRNPLTSIKMRLFSLDREFEEESSQKEDIQVIREEVDRLEDIVKNFLQFARPPEVKLEPTSISEVINGVTDFLLPKFESQDINIQYNSSDDNVMVLADKDQLRQVLMNILLNACDALPDGGDINLTHERIVEKELKMVRVRIGNSGPSIPPDDAANVFEPFFSTRDEGTGLGLSIAKRIIENHGGTIKLDEPQEGEGAIFSITLPAAIGEENEQNTDR